MDKLGVPCPQCGSIRVIVGDRAAGRAINRPIDGPEKPRLPLLHRCSCQDCRHTFEHDFSFCE